MRLCAIALLSRCPTLIAGSRDSGSFGRLLIVRCISLPFGSRVAIVLLIACFAHGHFSRWIKISIGMIATSGSVHA